MISSTKKIAWIYENISQNWLNVKIDCEINIIKTETNQGYNRKFRDIFSMK